MNEPVHRPIEPEGIYRPATYAMGMVAAGRTLYVAGQVARDAAGDSSARTTPLPKRARSTPTSGRCWPPPARDRNTWSR
jgi:enamine deaminase RidA (YjgF/YER057c/UK114 family)